MGLPDRLRGVRKVHGELAEIAPKPVPKKSRKDFSQLAQSLDRAGPQLFGGRLVGGEADVAVVVLDKCDVQPVRARVEAESVGRRTAIGVGRPRYDGARDRERVSGVVRGCRDRGVRRDDLKARAVLDGRRTRPHVVRSTNVIKIEARGHLPRLPPR